MKAELTHGNTPREGHSVLAQTNTNGKTYSFCGWVQSGLVIIQCTEPDGIATKPAEAMMCAEAIVRAVADADPEGFDALWMGLVASIRSARTRPVDLPTDLTCDKVNQQEEQYLQGTNETTA